MRADLRVPILVMIRMRTLFHGPALMSGLAT